MASDRPSRPHGTFTPASTVGRVLSRAGYKPFQTRRDTAFGGYRCTWVPHQSVTEVRYRCGDDTPEESRDVERQDMLSAYDELLTSKGYTVEWSASGYALHVHPKATPITPEEWSASGSALIVSPEPAQKPRTVG